MRNSYLNKRQLMGFENYKYNAVDTSPLSNYAMHPFWNAVVQIVPKNIAPNVLTFAGFLFTVANFVILGYFDYYYYAGSDEPPGDSYPQIPKWVWLLCALNHFLAHTLDGIDGKQARRTGTSGPLGELFDHGLDSWTTFYIPACLWSVFGRVDYSISPIRFYYVLWNVLTCFYVTHWEKYLTKVLFLPWGYDFSQVVVFVIYIVTGIWGQSIWKFNLFGCIPSGAIFEIMMYIGSLLTSIPMSFWNIYKSYKHETGKMLGFQEAFQPLVSPVLFFILSTTWVYTSPNDILNSDPRLFSFLVGVIFSNILSRLLVAQMSNTRCQILNFMLLPYTLTVLLVVLFPSTEFALTFTVTVLLCVGHIHYGVCVKKPIPLNVLKLKNVELKI